jgi:SAM-dependent methyltransferase
MNCDFIAPYYEIVERLCFGRRLERARLEFLAETKCARRALVCGGGDGRFLFRLLQSNPRVQVDFVDLSAKMIELARERVARRDSHNLARVTFHIADITKFVAFGEYDLIATNFFLDCFSNTENDYVIGKLSALATPDAIWLLSDFRESSGGIGKLWTRGVTQALYTAFRVTTGLRVNRLPDYAAALGRAGYQAQRERQFCAGLLYSSVWRRHFATPSATAVESQVPASTLETSDVTA